MIKTIFKRITINPEIRFGKPCIRGTRIAVADIINLLAAGFAINEIPREYPGITRLDVLAALEFTGQLMEKPAHLTKAFLHQVKTAK